MSTAVSCNRQLTFPTLIQRRMDDAMLFHTVIDKDTNLPYCIGLALLFRG